MDENHLLTAMRYVELNPVRAGLVSAPDQWRWISARAHLTGQDDGLVKAQSVVDYVSDWKRYLALDVSEEDLLRFGRHTRTGRPLGSDTFIASIEERLNRFLRKRKPGPKGPRKEN